MENINLLIIIWTLFKIEFVLLLPILYIKRKRKKYNYLVDYGFDKERLIMEKNSLTTVQNAQFSIPIAKKLGAKMIIVCSSPYHFADPQYKAMESFVKELEGSGIALMTYSKEINE